MDIVTNEGDFKNIKYSLNKPSKMRDLELFLSVSTGPGTYSSDDTVEMAIMFRDDKGYDFCYDMTGGDVVGWFPANEVQGFIEWFNTNYETSGFFVNSDGSNRNLPNAYLRDPNRKPIVPLYTDTPIL